MAFSCYFIFSLTKEKEILDTRSETNNFDVSSLSESYMGGGSPLLWLPFPPGWSGCKYLLVRTAKGRRKVETKGVP
jgi:hypothetical protein